MKLDEDGVDARAGLGRSCDEELQSRLPMMYPPSNAAYHIFLFANRELLILASAHGEKLRRPAMKYSHGVLGRLI